MNRFILILAFFVTARASTAWAVHSVIDGPDRQKEKRSALGTAIRNVIFIDSTKVEGQIFDEEKVYRKYNGRRIGKIYVVSHDIFERRRSFVQKAANDIHIVTSERVVRGDLLYAEGEEFDARTVVRSNQILQSRDYISRAWVSVAERGEEVDLTVITQDSWTIGADGGTYNGKRAMVDLYDINFLGSGAKFDVKSYFGYSPWRSRGEVVEVASPNILGTFYGGRIAAGREITRRLFEVEFARDFVRMNDYSAGISYRDVDDRQWEVYAPDQWLKTRVLEQRGDIWAGRTGKLKDNLSGYMNIRYTHADYHKRPEETARGVNNLFHRRDEIIVATGLYRERFLLSSMIYGYGYQEYVATGFRAEVSGGRSWQEFGDYWYAGTRLRKGGFWRGGFMLGDISAGGYFGRDGAMRRVVNAEIFAFSNLRGQGVNRMRQFVILRYTQGWRMGSGAGSMMGFSTRSVHPTGFRDYGAGRTRLLMKTETVVFTRHQPFGFRLAVFGFADAGTVGMSDNPFRNDFFSTFGLGVRFKNERLIFNALQLRVGFAVGREGFVRSRIFSITTEQRIEQHRLHPARAERVAFE